MSLAMVTAVSKQDQIPYKHISDAEQESYVLYM